MSFTNKATIEMTYEQIDAIVVAELKSWYEGLVRDYNKGVLVYDDEEDLVKTIKAVKRTLSYCMEHYEFKEYIKNTIKRKKK